MKKAANLKENNPQINRGEIYYLKKLSTLVLIISNRMHNSFSNYLTVILVVDQNGDQVRESLEVSFELDKEQKMKAVICCFSTVNKQQIYEQGILVGQVGQKLLEKINEKIKSVLDLIE
jgi:hypothetical protein